MHRNRDASLPDGRIYMPRKLTRHDRASASRCSRGIRGRIAARRMRRRRRGAHLMNDDDDISRVVVAMTSRRRRDPPRERSLFLPVASSRGDTHRSMTSAVAVLEWYRCDACRMMMRGTRTRRRNENGRGSSFYDTERIRPPRCLRRRRRRRGRWRRRRRYL